eukprot:TRINITY_DN36316_c0_g1_i1.p1 TRINITY_DN36316_c0_g1~~TRINITY_DN36316_c0_g1_i1.p1  ORF type:complete len:384 (+),score=99.23 TRINITY_DN36316_c0_g1_i1:79-1230(+)
MRAKRIAEQASGLGWEEQKGAGLRSREVGPLRSRDVWFLVAGYSVCSASLVVVNKWALLHFPFATALTGLQFAFSALSVWVLGVFGVCEVDRLELSKMRAFLPAVVLFYICIASSMKLLQHANVDMFIVARSVTPMATLAAEMACSGAPAPSRESVAALLLIVAGACAYAAADQGVKCDACGWAVLYVCATAVDQVVVKRVVTNVDLTRWGLVFYNNFVATCLFPLELWFVHQGAVPLSSATAELLSCEVLLPVAVSCVTGVGISFFGLNTRRAVTPTAFTVLGVVCKFGTVFINSVVTWSEDASPAAVACVCTCLTGGVLYQRAEKGRMVTTEAAAKQAGSGGRFWVAAAVGVGSVCCGVQDGADSRILALFFLLLSLCTAC